MWAPRGSRSITHESKDDEGTVGPNGLRPLFLAIVIYNGTEAWNDPAAGERPVPKNLLDYELPRLYRDMHTVRRSADRDHLVTASETMKSSRSTPGVGRRPGYRQAVAAIWFDQVVAPSEVARSAVGGASGHGTGRGGIDVGRDSQAVDRGVVPGGSAGGSTRGSAGGCDCHIARSGDSQVRRRGRCAESGPRSAGGTLRSGSSCSSGRRGSSNASRREEFIARTGG